ncbi:NAD(P)-dependent oxidoreductase [Cohnella nanjingensis]|uniref:NAD(P)-dependent oxidoreductase n=1 Tax=Cohnella nanjingensis TaxID=1387779 RepID=A0A7X0VDD1_9BACL|nr:NAD(P)-dependent oxidoreductase [Cohnella nanjingensis]MBB6669835.1 NAD(P)-dependent oxidoreductase [Cohnella nanjingensis]
MKIGIIGATGKAGGNILKEAASRGHDVTAIVRDASKLTDKVNVLEKDALALTAADLSSFDVVVNAFGNIENVSLHVELGNRLIDALKGTDTRLIVVGGAGSLFVDPEKKVRVVDTPDFPDFIKPLANAQGENLRILQGTSDLKWTFISPSAEFALGTRTGAYQSGQDNLLVNAKGRSYVSYEDYAIAVVDEIEQPRHIGERFTVVSEG